MTREEAIAKLEQYLDSNLIEDLSGNEGLDEAIRMGSDALKQPEIIRCRDCLYHQLRNGYCDKHHVTLHPLDFCSYGER